MRRVFRRLTLPALAVVACVLLVGVASASAAPTLVASVNLGQYPQGIATDPATNTVYVTAATADALDVIDGTTNTISATVPTGVNPAGVAVDPATDTIYVANMGSNDVTVVDGATNTVVTTIPIGESPVGIAVNPVTNEVYVGSRFDGNLTVIDGSTNTVSTTLDIGGTAYAVAVNPVTNMVYTANWFSSSDSIVDGATNTLVTTIPDGGIPAGIAVDSATNKVYISEFGGSAVSVLDGASNTITDTIPTGLNPYILSVGVDTATNTIYVANNSSGTVSAIDGATDTVIGSVYVGSNPVPVGVNSATGLVYVGLDGSFTLDVIRNVPPPDTTPPVLSLPSDITAEATGPGGAAVSYTATASDNVDGAVTPSCTPASGSTFALGTTTVDCTATDAAGNSTSGSFDVTVQDTTAPAIVFNGQSPAANGAGWNNGPVTLTWTCTDAVSGSSTVSQTLSGQGAAQSATGTCTDGAGNSSSDTEGGVNIDLTSPTVAFSPNGQTYDVNQTVSITCTASDGLSGVASSTCANVSGPAWSFGLGAHSLSASATDKAGNTATGTGSFTVVATGNGVCALVKQWESNAGEANSLCVKLQNAAASRAAGNGTAAANQLNAFRNELSAQSGKSISAANANELATLSRSL